MRNLMFTILSAVALVATGVVGAVAVGGTGTVDPPPRIAFLANGIVPADALAAGGIAGQLGAPLFTTPASSLNDDARDGIVDYDPDLVIVLGGHVAVSDAVVTALSAATGLTLTTTANPTDGIVRVAGGDRFATARAVAGLLAAYDPAYLPVHATALGAVDAATADMADDSDLLDGLDSTAFTASGQSCEPGEVVTEIDADGSIVCAPDQDEIDGGDADTLDGLHATDFALAGQGCNPGDVVTEIDATGSIVCAPDQDEIDGGDADTLDGLHATDVSFPGVLAPGKSMHGLAGTRESMAAGEAFGTFFQFPVAMPSLPTTHLIPYGGSSPQCTGSPTAPTAAPGFLCVYFVSSTNATLQSVDETRFGQVLTHTADSTGPVDVFFVWVATAS